MDPITGAMLVGGMGSIIGGIGQSQSNSMNIDQARENREWQMHMSNSAHQREVTDLKNAGLNPILSAGGSGASTPSGDSADGLGSPMNSLASGISKGMDTAIALRTQKQALALGEEQIGQTKADTHNKIAQQALIQNQAGESAKGIEAKTYTNKILQQTLDSQIKKAKAEGDYSELNQIMGLVNSGASSASSLVNPFKSLISPKAAPKTPPYSPLPKL